VQDADGFHFLVKEYVSGLMDGHAGVRPGHASPGFSAPRRWPFELMRLDGHFHVKTVEGGGERLRPGDEILSVNGIPVRDRFNTALAHSTASTVAGREYRALDTMRRGAEAQLHIKATRAGGSNFTCELPTLPRNATDEAAEKAVRWKKLEGNVGYLRLSSFAQDKKVREEGGPTIPGQTRGADGRRVLQRLRLFSELPFGRRAGNGVRGTSE
jgi:hypothetical protein